MLDHRLVVACGIMLIIAARCLRLGYQASNRLPEFSPGYALAVHLWFFAAFALVITALAVSTGEILLRLPSLPALPAGLRRAWRYIERVVPYALVAIVVLQKVRAVNGVSYFGTDGMLFSRYALDLMFSGKNPYAESMSPGFAAYDFAAPFSTYRLDGTTVDKLSYPAMSFLAFLPQALLGSRTFDLTSLAFLAATFFYLIAKSDGLLRWVPPALLFVHSDLLNFTAGGVFDIIWVLPLLITMQLWSKGRLFIAGLAYGLACSCKQTPWFIAPFLLIALFLESGGAADFGLPIAKRIARFVGGSVVSFVLTNLPFMVTAPRDWLAGVMTPVAGGAPLVELGQGLVLYNIVGTTHEPKVFFSLCMALAFIVFVWCFIAYYPRSKWLAWVAPMVILWFNYRSLHNYFVYSMPIAHMALVLRSREPRVALVKPRRRWLTPSVVASALALSAIAAIALAPRTVLPATLTILASHDEHELGRTSRMQVHVENTGQKAIVPGFLVNHAEHATPVFWTIVSGPETLDAGAAADYDLVAPLAQATVPVNASMQLRIYDRGHEAWSSLVVVPKRDALIPRPLVQNPSFAVTTQRDSGLYVPFAWITTPHRPPSWAHIGAQADGVHLGNSAGASVSTEAALVQSLDILPPSLNLDFTPMTVNADAQAMSGPGIEIRDRKRCIVVRVAGIGEKRSHPERLSGLDCTVVELPAKAGERMTTTISFADDVPQTQLAAMKGHVQLLLFAGVSSAGDTSVVFHRVSSDIVWRGAQKTN